VQAHGGKVWARSKPGQGTTFVLRLHRLEVGQPVPTEVKASDQARALVAAGGGVANILVCDDERSICEMLDISLRREGHRVETVQAGQLAKNKIDGALYDVIITDIKMPNIDGIEVLRHAHRVSPDSAVILITGWMTMRRGGSRKAGGASDYIGKALDWSMRSSWQSIARLRN